jgi:hypothetical protein
MQQPRHCTAQQLSYLHLDELLVVEGAHVVDQGRGELLVAPWAELWLLDPPVLIQNLLLTLAPLATEEGSPAVQPGTPSSNTLDGDA